MGWSTEQFGLTSATINSSGAQTSRSTSTTSGNYTNANVLNNYRHDAGINTSSSSSAGCSLNRKFDLNLEPLGGQKY